MSAPEPTSSTAPQLAPVEPLANGWGETPHRSAQIEPGGSLSATESLTSSPSADSRAAQAQSVGAVSLPPATPPSPLGPDAFPRLALSLQELSARIPPEWLALRQWVAWQLVHRNGDWTKQPTNPASGRPASSTDPSNWGTLAEALAWHESNPESRGVGLVFADGCGMVGIDIDDCVNADGSIAPWAHEILVKLPTYAEVSPSGCGIKMWAKAPTLPCGKNRRDFPVPGAGVEMYSRARYFTVTGSRLPDTPREVSDCSEAVAELYQRLLEDDKSKRTKSACVTAGGAHRNGGTTASVAGTPPPTEEGDLLDDDRLLDVAQRAKNGPKFSRLYSGDWKGVGYGSQSEGDLALLSMLAFYTGPDDPARLERLFRRSGLMRDKATRDDYLPRTIAAALAGRTEFWKRPASPSDGRTESGAARASVTKRFTPTLVDAVEVFSVNLPPLAWLIEDVIVKEANGFIGGPPKCFKSFVGVDACLAVATGTKFLRRFSVTPGRALYVSEEDGVRIVHRRVKRMIEGRGIAPESGRFQFLVHSGFMLDRPECVAWLHEYLVGFPADLVVLDVLSKLHTRQGNDAAEIIPLMKDLDAVRTQHGCSILVVAHFRKTQPGMSKDVQAGQRLAGTVGIHGSSESSIFLTRVGDDVRIGFEQKEADPHPDMLLTVGSGGEPVVGTLSNEGHDDGTSPIVLMATNPADRRKTRDRNAELALEALTAAWEAAGKPTDGVGKGAIMVEVNKLGGTFCDKTLRSLLSNPKNKKRLPGTHGPNHEAHFHPDPEALSQIARSDSHKGGEQLEIPVPEHHPSVGGQLAQTGHWWMEGTYPFNETRNGT